jgi:general secretion pathway protein K
MMARRTGIIREARGVALVTALLVVALATVAAVAMATQLQVDIRRTANLLHGEQAYAYALAAESWAAVVLRRDAGESEFDGLDEDWATTLAPIAVEGGQVNGLVIDLQGRFNINNLVDDSGQPVTAELDYFKRLLETLELDPELAIAVLDWIDPDINATFPGGAEDDAYLLEEPPYRTANRGLVSVSELRLVRGFTPEVMELLVPHVTALPVPVKINVNTATAQVLRALHGQLSEQGVAGLLEQREEGSFQELGEFMTHSALAGLSLDVEVDVRSDWFLVQTDVAIGAAVARLASILHRTGPAVPVLSRIRTTARLAPILDEDG